MTQKRACRVLATLLVIGWAAAASASCDGPGRTAGKSPVPAVDGRADGVAGQEGKGGTQLDFSQPPPGSGSSMRQPAPTVLQAVPTARPVRGDDPRVGALFEPDANGPHFCTASVVPSPGHDLVMTAAHCIYHGNGQGGQGKRQASVGIVFIPGYANGVGPYGVWTARALIVDPRWASGGDPDFDVGFVVLNPSNGQDIQDVVGANQIDFNAGYSHLVRVTGYPGRDDAPVTCENWTTQYSAAQLRFACGGFYAGTSGSPWVVEGYDAVARQQAKIVGVIGGYERGGDTSSVSYSVYLDSVIEALYERAEAASAAGTD